MKFQFKIILTTLAILIVALVLNSVLSLASFEKLYVASLVSTYEIAGKNLKRKIEKSLRFGKPLTKFTGMERLFAEILDTNPNISAVSITTPDRQVRYHTDKKIPVPAIQKMQYRFFAYRKSLVNVISQCGS